MAAVFRGSKVVAIGKNYAKHVIEMGGKGAKAPEAPMFFIKPASSVIYEGQPIRLPKGIGEVHHEVELGVIIGKRGYKISPDSWREYVSGYLVGLDMTARDLQAKAKLAGLPWTQAKCYDTFTPLSRTVACDAVPDPHNVELFFSIDGRDVQRGSTSAMLHRIPALLHAVSSVMTLEPHDVILTGTPEGVGPVSAGQRVTAGITGVVTVSFDVINDA